MSKGNELFNYKIAIGGVTFHFFEDENEYFYQMKDGEDIKTVLFCTCTDLSGESFLASYHKAWDANVSSAVINSFINRFLRDADYRKQFLREGENVCVVQKDEGIVNPRCEKMIQRINQKDAKNLRFKDFAALKTFGRDKVSSMREPLLIERLPEDDVEVIRNALNDKLDQIAAMRWQVRGLSCEYAIRKVKTDIEIRNNMK